MKVIGLTGGIATGVTTVAHVFKEHGAVVIEADQVAREIVQPGSPVLQKIVEVFGSKVLKRDGTLDRKQLADIVFQDATARHRLNTITHPTILRRVEEEVERLRVANPDAIVMIDLPLLLDTVGPEAYGIDGVIVVTASPEAQIKRLVARDRLSPKEAQQRLDAQRPVSEKEAEADWVIENNGSVEETRRQAEILWQELSS